MSHKDPKTIHYHSDDYMLKNNNTYNIELK